MHTLWPDNPATLHRGERSATFFLVFSWKQYNCIFYFIFKWKEENIQAHIDIIFLLRATTVHMFMFADITIQRMNRVSSIPWILLTRWLRVSSSLLHVHNKQKHPGKKPPNTYLSVHNNATTLAKYILHTSFISIFISPRC